MLCAGHGVSRNASSFEFWERIHEDRPSVGSHPGFTYGLGHYLCSVVSTANGVPQDACKSIYAMLLTAESQGRNVILWLNDDPNTVRPTVDGPGLRAGIGGANAPAAMRAWTQDTVTPINPLRLNL